MSVNKDKKEEFQVREGNVYEQGDPVKEDELGILPWILLGMAIVGIIIAAAA